MIEPVKEPEDPNLVAYVVQVATFEDSDGPETWEDIVTVKVPPRTKRSTVIKKALAEVGTLAVEKPPRLRALDVESAEVFKPEAYQPPIEWKL